MTLQRNEKGALGEAPELPECWQVNEKWMNHCWASSTDVSYLTLPSQDGPDGKRAREKHPRPFAASRIFEARRKVETSTSTAACYSTRRDQSVYSSFQTPDDSARKYPLLQTYHLLFIAVATNEPISGFTLESGVSACLFWLKNETLSRSGGYLGFHVR